MGQQSILPVQFRMARAALNWTVRDLAEKAGVHKNTVLRIEAGVATHGPTLAAVMRTLEEAGLRFFEAEEGVTGPGVAVKWGVELPQREPKADGKAGSDSQGTSQAASWDEGIEALCEEPAAAAGPEIEELRAYWRGHPAEWAGLSEAGQRVLLQEMRLDSFGAGVI